MLVQQCLEVKGKKKGNNPQVNESQCAFCLSEPYKLFERQFGDTHCPILHSPLHLQRCRCMHRHWNVTHLSMVVNVLPPKLLQSIVYWPMYILINGTLGGTQNVISDFTISDFENVLFLRVSQLTSKVIMKLLPASMNRKYVC